MLTLSAPSGDIDFQVVDGVEAVRQRVIQALRFHKAEWFLNSSLGVPYFENVFGYPLDTALASQVIIAFIRRVPEVTDVDVESVRFEPSTRTLFFKARVSTIFGDMELESST